MRNIVLRADNIGKQYTLGSKRSASLRETIGNLLSPGEPATNFWALRNVNFEIEEGQAVGVVGRNGAGKSTLLKILSRITHPSEGSVEINGRVSSLLEVGTGFHPELTGRENIYLNGTILGMRRLEIKSRLDEIVSFSGVERFIDTPIKQYSSGMKVRLAFSVAAHLHAKILLIDEVLAVGDFEFQRKCLAKMGEASYNGRTVLFVSHNMGAIQKFCPRSILLKNGQVAAFSDSTEVISLYLSGCTLQSDSGVFIFNNDGFQKGLQLTRVELFRDGRLSTLFAPGSEISVRIQYELKNFSEALKIGIVFKDINEVPLIGLNNEEVNGQLFRCSTDSGVISFTITQLPLIKPGKYFIDVYLGSHEEDYIKVLSEISFMVEKTDVYKTGRLVNDQLNLIFCPDVTISLNEEG